MTLLIIIFECVTVLLKSYFVKTTCAVIAKRDLHVLKGLKSFLISSFLLILIIGVLILYDRLTNKQSIELEKQNTILNFHQYVQEKTQEKTQEIK